jgi:hypothetical protein
MADVIIKSREQYLGQLIRALKNNSDITDFAAGSNAATLFEAISQTHYQLAVSQLKILQSTALENLTGNQLDQKAESIKLPNGEGGVGRKPARASANLVRIGSGFSKISSKLYAGKPAPFAGSSSLFVENAESFPSVGSIYLARGTVDRFEGPIPYSSVTNNGSFWTLTLSNPLTKSHLHSDLVVVAQGGDRVVDAGTTILVPANSESPAIQFTTTQAATLFDGESEVDVPVVCTQTGEAGNVLAGAIKSFNSEPFAGATVTNVTSFTNGRSSENDEDLRQRIKTYPATLSRGTSAALLAAIQGASDPSTGRTIQSSVLLPPVEAGDLARIYIDDGVGLEPTFLTQSYELLLQSASGQETRFRSAQSPMTASVAEGSNSGPFVLTDGQTIVMHLDEVVETYQINASNYKNLNSATAYEVVRDLNSQSNIIGFRTLDGGKRIAAIDLSGNAEIMRIELGDLQTILGLPTAELRPIFLYINSKLQSFRGHTATLSTRERNAWTFNSGDLTNVRVSVDGVIQTITIVDADFTEFSSNITTATITQWATVLSRKIAGVKFTVSGQILVWSTYQTFSPSGSLEILETKADGTPAGWVGATKMWLPSTAGGILKDTGFAKNFKLNRFTGEINLSEKPDSGSTIEIGNRSTRAFLRTNKASTGLYTLSSSAAVGNARMVLGFDGQFAIREVVVPSSSTFTPSLPDAVNASNIIRLSCNAVDVFENAEVGDWLYLIKDTTAVPSWTSDVEGFYRIKAVGNHKFATNQTYTALSGATGYTAASLTAATKKDSSIVTVTWTDHTLQTGDLISVSTATAIGGISGANLSVSNVPVTVLSSGTFQYTALAAATSASSGLLANTGTNIIIVTQSNHGFSSGALINTTVTTGFAAISNANLSVTAAPIEVTSINAYRFRALAAMGTFPPVPATGTIDSLVYIADTWIEFEVSSPQLVGWTPLLSAAQSITADMINLFRSTSQPQLVDFGAISTATVDQVVSAINSAIAGGYAIKLSPQQAEIRSGDYENGTVAVLATVGTADDLIDTGVASSIQAHAAFSSSGYTQAGQPVVTDIPLPTSSLSGYPTRTYLKIDKDLTDILDAAANPAINQPTSFSGAYPEGFQHMWLTGRASGLSARVYNNQVASPYTGILSGTDSIRPLNTSDTEQTSPDTLNRYANYGLRFRDLGINNHDKLVLELDLNPIDKTVAIQLSKIAKIQDIDSIAGSGKGQVISFRLKDPDDSDKPFFDNTSVYKAFDFSDFKILTKSVGLYREDVSDRVVVLRSTSYGAAHQLRMMVQYAAEPDVADFVISHSNDFLNNVARLNLIVSLPSQSLIAGSLLSTGSYKIVATASGTLYDWRITAGGSFNAGLVYQAGNILNISGSSALSSSYKILSSTYNTWANPVATTTPGSNVVSVAQVGHGFLSGDLVDVIAGADIGGIPFANLSQLGTAITFIDANNFSYIASASAPSNTGTISTVTRPAITLNSASGNTTNLSSVVTVIFAGHGLQTGNLVNVTTSTAIGGISAIDLSQSNTAITRIDANTFSYVAGAAATATGGGIIDLIDRPVVNYASVAATTTNGSTVVQLVQTSHGFQTNDLINVSTASAIGGISASNLSVTGAAITVINVNTFNYNASAASPAASGNLTSVSGGSVTIKAPGSGGLAPSALFNAASAPVRSWDLVDKTLTELATAINDYNPSFPVATATATGSSLATTFIAKATYEIYPAASAYTGSDISGAFSHHAFGCKYSGSAGIWQYDSSNASLNNIKATVQSVDSIYPTTAEASGTSYTPINEVVYIVPTNTKTLARWLSFNAASSLSLLSNIERIQSDDVLQISSKQDGSTGGVKITGVTANKISSAVLGNATSNENAIIVSVLNADAKAVVKNAMIKLKNQIASEIQRPYRVTPTGASITTSNTTEINTFFRQTTALKYIRVDNNTGRLIFLRNGMGPSQTEPLGVNNTIQFTNLGSGLVQVTSAQAGGGAGTGKLAARVGDQMYIQPLATNFTIDHRCKEIPVTGLTDGTKPEYLGFPVVHVINDNNIVILAPSITNFSTITVGAATDLVFLPSVWNEKNIRTNHQEGTSFDSIINNNQAYFLIKALGSGFMSLWMQNSSTEATDDMKLDMMSVGTDDFLVLSEGFDAANTGTFRIVAHNGRNHIIFYNPDGQDEILDTNNLANGGTGDRKWRVGPLNNGITRSVRILASECVRIGDRLRISTPSVNSQWFNSSFFGSWEISKIGYQGIDYTGAALPHTTTSGTALAANICPYVDFVFPNAPISVTDSSNTHINSFLVGSNDKSIGFVEGTPFEVIRHVSGQAVSPLNPAHAEVFLVPKIADSKFSDTFGTQIEVFGKAGYLEQTFQGIDGYKVYAGLVQEAHRIIDGLPTNTVLYPGVKAAGAQVEVLPPIIRSIQMDLQVRPKDGVTLNSISELIQSTVANYINSLGEGKPVVLSEIVRVVQSLPGVFSVTIISTLPAATDDRIVVADNEKALVLDITESISVG